MSDIRARRTAVLAAAAKAKSEAKAHAADQALRRLVRRGEPVTFQAVQREAGVSHAFLYGHPDLRARIEHLRAQARPQPVPASDANGDNTIAAELHLSVKTVSTFRARILEKMEMTNNAELIRYAVLQGLHE